MSLSWFKHYNTAHEGQLIGDLLVQKEYEAVALFYVLMELISRFEDPETRGRASIPVERIARAMNMKPTRIDRLLGCISSVSRSDLICETDEKQPRNRVFLMRNWMKYQETRGGKREAKIEQSAGRSKKREDRSKKEEGRSKNKNKNIYIPEGVENAPARVGVGSEIWEAYRGAYKARYGVEPIRNATTNSQCSALGRRLGAAAIEVVRFYLTHNDGFYLRNQHPIGICLSQAESLHTQWQRGVAVTATQVREFEKTQTTQNAVEGALEILNRRNQA